MRTTPGRRHDGDQKDDLGFGVVVSLVAMAILTTPTLLRWIGWLGLLAIVRNPLLANQCRSFSTLGWCRLRLLRKCPLWV